MNGISFKGRLLTNDRIENKSRWQNIAKQFKEETKGDNYESYVYFNDGKLNICTDRVERKNQKYDYISDFTTRETELTKDGTIALMSRPDGEIAKILAKHLKFIKKFDNTSKTVDKLLDQMLDKIDNMFAQKGLSFDPNSLFGDISVSSIVKHNLDPDYKALQKEIGFQNAEISHLRDY